MTNATELSLELNHIIIVLGAFLGSVKTCYTINQSTPLCEKMIDISLGLFCGVMVGHYFTNNMNLYVTGLLALLGGIAGAVVIDVIIELLPKIAKDYITNFVRKNK